MKIKLLYLNNSMWEVDFIINDVLFNIEKEVEFYDSSNLKLFLNRTDIIENNILVINKVCNFHDIISVVQYIKPIIIFYMSDECGDESHITLLEQYTKILFRQYNHKKYNYSNNSYQLPLGYSKYFLGGKNSLCIQHKKINEREINSSFIGSFKSDRNHMVNVFNTNMEKTKFVFVNNSWNIDNLPYSPELCFNIYNNSIFVIIGRGNVSLDCFRIYEAIVSGAIPVVVGNMDEIETTFNYNNSIPPLIYDDTWENAVVKCNNLLKDNKKLQEIQDNLITWWNNRILFINGLINKEIEKL